MAINSVIADFDFTKKYYTSATALGHKKINQVKNCVRKLIKDQILMLYCICL